MIPNRELEKVVKPERDTVIPVWEHRKKCLIPEWDTLEEDPENCNLEKVTSVKTDIAQMHKVLENN